MSESEMLFEDESASDLLDYAHGLLNEEGELEPHSITFLDSLVASLIEKFGVDLVPGAAPVSYVVVSTAAMDAIEESYDSGSPEEVFISVIEEELSDLKDIGITDFDVFFAINLSDDTLYDTFSVREYTLQRRTQSEVREAIFAEQRSTDPLLEKTLLEAFGISEQPNPDDVDEVFSVSHNEENWHGRFENSMSYYSVTVPAFDPFFAISRVSDVAETFTSKLIYSFKRYHSKVLPNLFEHPAQPWHDVTATAFFVKQETPEPVESMANRAFAVESKSHTTHISENFASQPSTTFDDLPEFSREPSRPESDLLHGLKLYRKGMQENEPANSFLYFWQSLETLVQTQPGQPSGEVINRAEAVNSFLNEPLDIPLFEAVVPQLPDYRNDIAHGEVVSENQEAFLQVTKLLVDLCIEYYSRMMDKFESIDDFVYSFEHLSKSESRQNVVRNVSSTLSKHKS